MTFNDVFIAIACLVAIHAIYRGYQRRVRYEVLDGVQFGLMIACVQSQCHWLVGVLVQLVWTYFKRSASAEREKIRIDKETKEKKKEKRRVPPESNWKQYYMGPVRLRTGDHRINSNMGSPRLVFNVCLDRHVHHLDQQKRMREQYRALVAARS